MPTVLPSEFKRGLVLMLDGAPHFIEEMHTSGTAQTKHKLHVRLRNVKTSRLLDRVFNENERVPLADLEHRRAQFSYVKGDTYVFLDTLSYDEYELTVDQLGDRRFFLKEQAECKALLLESKLIEITLPTQVSLRVVETAPAQKGGSDSTWKSARLETGLETMVPLFIARDDVIWIDTTTRKYAGKEN